MIEIHLAVSRKDRFLTRLKENGEVFGVFGGIEEELFITTKEELTLEKTYEILNIIFENYPEYKESPLTISIDKQRV